VSPERTLRDVFGLESFRPGQSEVVRAQLEGRDVLSVAPTGSGKSISYWVPALLQPGVTIVVSPLIALMKDQVDRLRSHDVAATFINSSIDRAEQWRRLQAARAGQIKLLYLAPERFSREGFVGVLPQLTVSRFVVDEAHCISTWGHDFRPDYRLLGRAIEACRRPPIAAFTATATPQVRTDIVRSLGLVDPVVSVTGFHRPNLLLEGRRCRNDDEKLQVVRQRLQGERGRALVYCATVRATEELAGELRRRGHQAAAYHAQLEEEPRRRIQDDFAAGKLRVVAATIAFGMGVDIPDIRQVIHFHLPSSLEGYYQEAGRAGRDGDPARCLLLWRPGDRDIQSFLIERTFEQAGGSPEAEERRNHAYAKLQLIHAYANLRTCRHARIADYFGEEGVARTCQACDNCLDESRPAEEPVDNERVRVALAGIGRHHGRLGAANVAAILAGADTKWLRDRPWAMQKPAYGSLGDWSQDRVRALLSELVEAGLARQSAGEYPTLLLTEEGREVLLRRQEAHVTLPSLAPPPTSASGGRSQSAPSGGPLFERLRRWRLEKSRELGVPAYVVLKDQALAELAARRPTNPDALLAVPGIGPSKLERFGSELLQLLAEARPA
jgi:ATP-dependent DNA helicase RecQ